MTDLLTMLAGLKRPRTLIRAARIGVLDYRRAPTLKRLLGFGHPTKTAAVVMALVQLEAEMNELRETHSTAYSATRHVEVMIALMSEAHVLQDATTG